MSNAISQKESLLQKMGSKVSNLTTAQLCECFVLTNTQDGAEIPTVRGVLMDELQGRDSAAFDQWMETCDTALMDSPAHFFTPSTSRFPAVRRLLCSCCGAVTLSHLHPDCQDMDLPGRMNEWQNQWPASRGKIERYLRTFFGKQLRFR